MNQSAAELFAAALASGDPDHDPFAAFDASTGAGAGGDPYAYWAELQARSGVHFGTGVPPPDVSPLDLMFADREVATMLSHQAVDTAFRNNSTFSSSTYAVTFDLVWGRTLIGMDGREHARYRALVQRAFSRQEMDRWEALTRPIVRRYLEPVARHGRADLVRDLFVVFPVTVIAEALGLPAGDLPMFFRLTVEMSNILGEPERAFLASMSLAAYLQGQLDDRRLSPGVDLLSQLIDARLEPEAADDASRDLALSDEEIISMVRLLLIAGAETTARSSATMILLLLNHPDQFAAVQADRSLIPACVEEALRFEPPLAFGITRFATADTEVAGCPVHEGTFVKQAIGAANRDPERWENPNEFDIARPIKSHLAFGLGAHLCLGMHVARAEMRIALEEILDLLHDLHLDPDAEPPTIAGRELRSPAHVPVVFNPRAT